VTSRDSEKRAAARAALEYVLPDAVLGVGTGSTVAFFIETLAENRRYPLAVVATSRDTERRVRALGIRVVDLNELEYPIPVYVDGADEVDLRGYAIKGGGGAHAREKRVAMAADTWVCIVDSGKFVERIGRRAPVPLEVEPHLLQEVSAAVEALGGRPVVRDGWRADSGNLLVDVSALDLSEPLATENALEAIPGIVACGIFALRRADLIIVGQVDGSAELIVPERNEADTTDPKGTR
jgi:ribose 5-phosphate isomerase A